MSFTRWLQKLRYGAAPRKITRRPSPLGARPTTIFQPRFETLEERLALSFIWGGSSPDAPPGVEWAPPPPLLADFTSDGIPDRINGGWVTVEPGLGDGTFADPIDSGVWGDYLAVADFNGDSRLDLVTAWSNWAGDQPIGNVLLGLGDVSFYGWEPFDLGLASPTRMGIGDFNGDGRADVAIAGLDWDSATNAFVVLINDGNWPSAPLSVNIGDSTITEGDAGTASGTFAVTLSGPSTETVTVAYNTGNGTATAGSDYTATSGTLTFAPGEMNKTITIPVIGDRVGESNEIFSVHLSNPSNATIADGQGVGTIVDDEPRVSIGDVSSSEGKKGATTLFTFTVTLSAAYDQSVTMSFTTVNGTAKKSDADYVAKTGTLTFAPGETTKTITIEVKGDSKKEIDETFYLDLYGLSSNSLFTKKRGIGTILNDD